MRYNDAIRTAVRHMKEGSEHIALSMARQVQAHEGVKAAEEFCKEVEVRAKEGNKQYFT